MDFCAIQQPHSSMYHSMGTHLTLQAIPPAILQVTNPLETYPIYKKNPLTLSNKMCVTV